MIVKQPLTKLYYSIGELAEMYEVNQSLIRYWEKEFTEFNPGKNRNGVRKYTKKDIELFDQIFQLIKVKGLTLDGAKKAIISDDESSNQDKGHLNSLLLKLENLRTKLAQLKSKLNSGDGV